jgi:predicted lipoprotein with Yx(FWY)xxD motif
MKHSQNQPRSRSERRNTVPRGPGRRWMTKSLLVGGGLVAASVLAAACGSSSATKATSAAAASSPATSATSPASATATVNVETLPSLGPVLVNSSGRTLYLFTPDHQQSSTCTASGGCLTAWPRLDASAAPVGGPGVQAALLGTVKDSNGDTQVTYNRWPLYTFAGDTAPKQAAGEGLDSDGGTWYVINASGQPVHATPTAAKAVTPTDASGVSY